jgi:hypothetical protein
MTSIPEATEGEASDFQEAQHPRRVPALVTYLSPFRIVNPSLESKWQCSIVQVNQQTWDFTQLHEIVGSIDVGLDKPYCLVVSRDGAIALPPLQIFLDTQKAVSFFNKILAALLLGGIYVEAINIDSVEKGSLIDYSYIRSHVSGLSLSSQFHELIRLRMAPPILAIQLYRPRQIVFEDLNNAAAMGFKAINSVVRLVPEYLLKGITGIARKDAGAALSNLWIVVEQLTEELWQRHLKNIDLELDIPGRSSQLSDNRTWTTSVKQEVLYQSNVVDSVTLKALSRARKARNELVHRGREPSFEDAQSALQATRHLLRIATNNDALGFFSLDLSKHEISDPFAPKSTTMHPEFWMPIPKLPGEEEIEHQEAERKRPRTA